MKIDLKKLKCEIIKFIGEFFFIFGFGAGFFTIIWFIWEDEINDRKIEKTAYTICEEELKKYPTQFNRKALVDCIDAEIRLKRFERRAERLKK